jgi:hypothetical protein
MLERMFLLFVAAAVQIVGVQAQQGRATNDQSPQPLEIRIMKPPQWNNGCLQVSFQRVNRSAAPLFLPVQGLHIASSFKLSSNVPGKENGEKLLVVNGGSEIVMLDANTLAPGASLSDDYCIGPTLAVVSLQKKTRREVPLRGKLKIYTHYFLTERDWLTHKSQRQQMFRTTPNKWPKVLQPQVATVEMRIPCPKPNCGAAWDEPPPILGDENAPLPDVASTIPEWNVRGKKINEELARKSPPCPDLVLGFINTVTYISLALSPSLG